MAAKRSRKSGKKVKSLRAKSLSGKKSKSVKGGARILHDDESPKESIR